MTPQFLISHEILFLFIPLAFFLLIAVWGTFPPNSAHIRSPWRVSKTDPGNLDGAPGSFLPDRNQIAFLKNLR
jgi:hypothetical protein